MFKSVHLIDSPPQMQYKGLGLGLVLGSVDKMADRKIFDTKESCRYHVTAAVRYGVRLRLVYTIRSPTP